MAWYLDTFKIENFKFFKKEETFEVKGRNVLIYGENGAGKSSLYWALYTMLQSCFKVATPEGAQKYFVNNPSQSLRNRYSQDTDYSGLKVRFSHSDGISHKDFEDSSISCNTTCDFMRLTAIASDFISYKSFSEIFDFTNKEEAEVYKIFEREAFSSLVLDSALQLIHVDGSDPNTRNASYWIEYVNQCIRYLPRGKNHKYVIRTNVEYTRFKNLMDELNRQLSTYISKIEYNTNEKLTKDFGLNVNIELKYQGFEVKDIPSSQAVDCYIKVSKPTIILKAKLTDVKAGGRDHIERPHTFFNEAKLTYIAFAIRLSMLEQRYSPMDDSTSLLVVDDILTGLDMSNRMKVVDYLLSYDKDHQLFIFTHNRSFYQLVLDRIETENYKKSWLILEMYAAKDSHNIPAPAIYSHCTALDSVSKYLYRHDYPVAANYLRKACEMEISRLLDYNDTLVEPHEELSIRNKSLATNLSGLRDFYAKYGMPEVTGDLSFYRSHLMNPMSHGDVRTQVYRGEIESALAEVKKLHSIESREIISKELCRENAIYKIEMNQDGKDVKLQFYFKEPWRCLSYQGIDYYNNPRIIQTYSSWRKVDEDVKNNEIGLKSIFKKMCIHLWGEDESWYPDLSDVVLPLSDVNN